MKTHVIGAFVLAASAFIPAACHSVTPTEVKSRGAYRNGFDFVWNSAKDELKAKWRIESEDRAQRTMETEWDVNLSPLSSFGRRTRLLIRMDGNDTDGWNVSCTQESEENGNEQNPLSTKEASWSGTPNDGARAMQFLQNLDRLLSEDPGWKSRDRR